MAKTKRSKPPAREKATPKTPRLPPLTLGPAETQAVALSAARSSVSDCYRVLATLFSHATDVDDEFACKLASDLYIALHSAEINVQHAIACSHAIRGTGVAETTGGES